jgi:hypothetical protein
MFAHREDDFPAGCLHWETYRHSTLPQQVDTPNNIVRSLRVVAHEKLSATTSLRKRSGKSRGKKPERPPAHRFPTSSPHPGRTEAERNLCLRETL